MNVYDLPTLNATLNFVATILLLLGYVAIKKGNEALHRRFMLGALITSALFLVFYLIYHYHVGSVPYPKTDWTRSLYFIILIPHIILATVMVPFILLAVFRAYQGKIVQHKRIVRWVWPVWMYVSVSGVVVYFMLYVF